MSHEHHTAGPVNTVHLHTVVLLHYRVSFQFVEYVLFVENIFSTLLYGFSDVFGDCVDMRFLGCSKPFLAHCYVVWDVWDVLVVSCRLTCFWHGFLHSG